jgi:ABC-type multidrug transport system fused ATPase/permease subunit
MNEKDRFDDLKERARSNAFAHREAMNENSLKDKIFFVIAISFSLISIFAIILSYINQNTLSEPDAEKFYTLLSSLDYALISIVATFISLITTIYSNHRRYGIIAEQHKFLQHSHIHIAQRSRAAKNLNLEPDDLSSLYTELQRGFEDIKVRGIEPQHEHFKKANKIEEYRKNSKREKAGIVKYFHEFISKIWKPNNKFETKVNEHKDICCAIGNNQKRHFLRLGRRKISSRGKRTYLHKH